jgi:hypothetical protein
MICPNYDGAETIEMEFTYDQPYILPTLPTRDNFYGFNGYDLPSSGIWKFAQDTTFTAQWLAIYTVSSTTITGLTDFGKTFTEITIPNGITSIGGGAFRYYTGLTKITIPDSVTSIGGGAFYDCTGLTEITIPDSITNIGGGAFSNCTGLTSITVSSENTVYRSEGNCLIRRSDNTLILGCNTSIIPNSITNIGSYAFSSCKGLSAVTIPNSVTNIGNSAFGGCTGLTNITVASENTVYRSEGNCLIQKSDNTLILGCKTSVIPTGVTSIGSHAFVSCIGLSAVTIPNSVTLIDGFAFSFCTGLTEIIIPDSVIVISNYAFEYCTGLTSVTFGNSVTIIHAGAFSNCTGLTSIIIPDSVTVIYERAFSNCTNLTIYAEATGVPNDWDSNWNISNCPVYWAGQWHIDGETGLPVPN